MSSRDIVHKANNFLINWTLDPRPRVISKFLMEAFASMMFHFLGTMSATPWSNGVTLMVLVYYTAKTSGAHINPALSTTFTILGYTNPIELLVYWTAQISGAIIGALWLALLVPGSSVRGYGLGCFNPVSSLTPAAIIGWEALCTFTFIVPIFSVVWYTNHKKGYGNTGPILVGLSLIASASAASAYTGGALNPARVLASPIVFDCMKKRVNIFYYIIGEMMGGILAPLVIMPWYGIAPKAWYIDWIPDHVKKRYTKIFRITLVDGTESKRIEKDIEIQEIS
jgi:aquaporin Z